MENIDIPKSDIGNLYDYLREYNDDQIHDFSYLSHRWSNIEQWKIVARNKVLELLHYFPQIVPLEPQTLGVIDRGTYFEEEVSYQTAKHVRIRAKLLIPKTSEPQLPAVIALHDHGGFYYFGIEKVLEMDNEPPILIDFKEKYYGGRSWASELVKRGYVVLIPESYYFGSRKLDLSNVSNEILEKSPYRFDHLDIGSDEYIRRFNLFSSGSQFEGNLVRHILAAGTTWPGIIFHDDRRSVDYLMTRKEVDTSRIACCGLSIGGYRSAYLAALDPRISCAVVTGWMPTYESLLFNKLLDHTFMIYIPGLTRYMEFPDVMSLLAPQPLMVQQCVQDGLFHMEGMEKAEKKIREVYTSIHFEKKFKCSYYDVPHQFNVEMQEDAFAWIDQWFLPKRR
jgi:dienelactone hydrolase